MHAEKIKCKKCGKMLVDEKFFCRRCNLVYRNKARKAAAIVGGVVGTGLFLWSRSNNTNKGDDDSQI